MSRGHQRVIVTGHLGADPEVKAPQAGGLIADFRVAVTEVFKNRAGEREEHTEWLRIKAFNRCAEIAQQYLRKGSLVTIEGKLRTERWQASDGSDRYSAWIYCDPRGLTLHGGREHARTGVEHQGRSSAPPGRAPAQPQPGDVDDDIPF
ncbi:single-stranded DNA-binding protein [Pseudoxanthomonas winnipegensis]|uniref:Single-stranded DNA-binding protein n=1 Tax=Pseudoxanthomonas winnipegensis TaxID=2480810 RepID=A0A4Q8LKL4_9GAMM|nr:single-stranded DNA-binding protein [Pseudoxanthomonas winnipegensis]RZZ87834.1 single-stranded DNA-binding protein [Pseudoxanthomonas winnipegensis]TAA29971.1 single-stranded DNA-binding protein [Pseudoxanthomonas winnipegensis]TBV78113.1 single-stranded DNA-binding protein [Pseudoxanthomonas winnipegensis]